MKRFAIVFSLLIATFVILLARKVIENDEAALKASGGSGVVEGLEVDVTSRLMSRIVEISAKEGDKVERGTILVRLDCEEPLALNEAAKARLSAVQHQAEAARAQLDAAVGAASAASANVNAAGAQKEALETNQAVAARQVQRIDRLRGEGGATEMELDRASSQAAQLTQQLSALNAQEQAARGQARAARAQSEAAKAQAEAAVTAIAAAKADVLRSEAVVRECTLTAPISGYVKTRALEVGEVTLPGSRILTLVDITDVEIDFYLPNRELAAAAPGRAVTILADAYPERTFKGEIEAVSPTAEFTPRNVQTREDRDRLVYRVTVRAPNTDDALRPGMPVEITVDGTEGGREPIGEASQ
ncbi:MAG: efflux RND transporter periplasmic adaptor subunit [Deltaproteobacteria bacterium]|nr:efflux RND transporter periplasmic adaptor subunit [Deltaproteobacteria bacterium]